MSTSTRTWYRYRYRYWYGYRYIPKNPSYLPKTTLIYVHIQADPTCSGSGGSPKCAGVRRDRALAKTSGVANETGWWLEPAEGFLWQAGVSPPWSETRALSHSRSLTGCSSNKVYCQLRVDCWGPLVTANSRKLSHFLPAVITGFVV